MTVDKVVLVPEDRTVVHHGRVGDRLLCEGIVGSCVHLHVDPDTRLRHARLHTAGHVLAHATHQCVEGVLGTKGHHFPDGSYVEFSGVVPPEAGDIIQERINRLVAENAEVIVEVLRRADMVQRCAVLPDRLPEGDEFRVVSFGERSGSPCGGTHVQSLGELGRVVVGKIRTRKGKSKISYTVEGPRAGPSPLQTIILRVYVFFPCLLLLPCLLVEHVVLKDEQNIIGNGNETQAELDHIARNATPAVIMGCIHKFLKDRERTTRNIAKDVLNRPPHRALSPIIHPRLRRVLDEGDKHLDEPQDVQEPQEIAVHERIGQGGHNNTREKHKHQTSLA
eukprot:TRINITY_DN1602_c0_g1_i3.p1 TRINITY_DN1602_c0_g1~~TRINITY_DN1602_c0_g1_i3.p1  ORF type:complete len:379 (-),score=51.44 TRINITY_DN1602_c0_g1_i3:364-1371(-)